MSTLSGSSRLTHAELQLAQEKANTYARQVDQLLSGTKEQVDLDRLGSSSVLLQEFNLKMERGHAKDAIALLRNKGMVKKRPVTARLSR